MREPCVAGLRCVACAALCLFVCSPSLLGESRVEGRVELLRDTWGIPHVLADTDAGAFYGLGYAMAEDRGFQMTYGLRIVQGRLAEVVGVVNRLGREESSLDHDKKMRTFGFHCAAEQVVENLDEETRAMLQAYCAGVNDGFRDQGDDLHPLFAEYELAIEPWTPADCLASWWHMAQFFATDGTRDLIAMRNRGRDRTALLLQARGGGRVPIGRGELDPEDLPRPLPPDDGPAIVKREDLSDEWIERVQQFAREHPGSARPGDGEAGPKFSHAWIVGGTRTSTGSSVLASDPQTPVRNPSLFYEFHLQGETFNVRGIGVPGSPMLLIGFSEHVAWGVTALGADQADLFSAEDGSCAPRRLLL
jgi:penicillin amidase